MEGTTIMVAQIKALFKRLVVCDFEDYVSDAMLMVNISVTVDELHVAVRCEPFFSVSVTVDTYQVVASVRLCGKGVTIGPRLRFYDWESDED